MRIEALKYRNEDNQDIIIIVEFYGSFEKHEWRIADIKYKIAGRHKYSYLSEIFYNDIDYRRLDLEGRKLYAMHKYEEFVGREKLERAVANAWIALKPKLNEIQAVDV